MGALLAAAMSGAMPPGRPVNMSRRGMFAAAGAGLFLGLAIPGRAPRADQATRKRWLPDSRV